MLLYPILQILSQVNSGINNNETINHPRIRKYEINKNKSEHRNGHCDYRIKNVHYLCKSCIIYSVRMFPYLNNVEGFASLVCGKWQHWLETCRLFTMNCGCMAHADSLLALSLQCSVRQ